MRFFYQKLATCITFCMASLAVYGQVSTKLSGTVIGSKYSVDYDKDSQQSTTVNIKDNVFDDDFNTFFAAYDRSNGWVGLDLGSPHVITKVAWAPRNTGIGPKRCELAIFEGANDPDFLDAVPLYIVTSPSETGRMHSAPVQVSRGFRYVRYVGPHDARCNLGELAFYGYSGVGDDSHFFQLTNLPTVSIHTVRGADPEHKGEDFESSFSIIYDGGTRIQEAPVLTRVRGNASAGFAKKPYRIKFSDNTSRRIMPGSPLQSRAKAKKWTLLSNYGDKALMRNILAFELSRRLQAPYTVWCQPVDVIMNGEYHGCYQFCDQITIDPHRVPVVEMGPTDVEAPFITGGYLLEIDAYASNEPVQSWFTSSRGTPVTIKEPDEDGIVPVQYNYIKNHFNKMEDKLFSANYTDDTQGYRSMLDLSSFLKHFIVGELSGNTDTYWSVYLYKNRMDDIFYVGPCWDFDLAFENDTRTYPVCQRTNWLFASGGSTASGMVSFVNRILQDAKAYIELRLMWKQMRDQGLFSLESLLAYVDSTAQVLDQSQRLNFKRWDIFNTNTHQNPLFPGSYQGEVGTIRTYLKERIQWMDEKLLYTPGGIDDGTGRTFDIASAKDLVEFVKKVNAGMVYANARLTADINLLAYRPQLNPIGSTASPYRGIFDGQGHSLSNLGCMLFGTTDGATIKNVGLESGTVVQNLNYAAHAGTLVGCCAGQNPTVITNCYSRVNLSGVSGDAGGLVGRLFGTLSNSFYAGIVRVSGVAGGLIGSSLSEQQPANVDHCYVASTQIKSSGAPEKRGALAGHLHRGSQLFRCFSLEELMGVVGTKEGNTLLCLPRSRELFTSGSVCWLLNDNSSSAPNWFQTLGQDEFPLLDPAHAIVIYKDNAYTNVPGSSIEDNWAESQRLVDVHTLDGRLMRRNVPAHRALQGLPHGIYLVGGVKVAI